MEQPQPTPRVLIAPLPSISGVFPLFGDASTPKVVARRRIAVSLPSVDCVHETPNQLLRG